MHITSASRFPMPTWSATVWTMPNATAICRMCACWKIRRRIGRRVSCCAMTSFRGGAVRAAAMMKPVKTTVSQLCGASEWNPAAGMADVVNTTLDLETTLRRVAELVRKVIDYEIFAILLLNEPLQELYVRFHVGYPEKVAERVRVKWAGRNRARGADSPGSARRRCHAGRFYIEALPNVHSELAIPLIVKNRLIGVIDLEARERGYFTEEHKRLLTLIASRMAVGIENARCTRAPRARPARCFC